MNAYEIDATLICVDYYKDEAIESVPAIAEEYDYNSVVNTVKTYASKMHYCWLNAYEGQRVVGFVGGYLADTPWNNKILTGNIVFLFLLESHRNMDNFKMLVNEFENWARMNKAKYVTGGDLGLNYERSKKLYQHLGFEPMLLMNKEL
jgi:GNAT superfamily N-acetyltransferase